MKKLIMAVIETGQTTCSPDVALPLLGDKAVSKEDAREVLEDFLDVLYNDLEREKDDIDD